MKSKKFLGFLLSLGLVCSILLSSTLVFSAGAETTDEANEYFVEFVLSDTNYNGEIDYTHTPLYNENLEVCGRQYIFTVGNVDGYALMIALPGVDKTFYEIEELFYNKPSPFAECEGLPVYITHRLYLDYTNNQFYNLENGATVSAEDLQAFAYQGFGYSGLSEGVANTVTVNYGAKTTTTYSIKYDLPSYFGAVGTNCANIAGAVVIGYYDRFFENLIPNYQVYTQIGSVLVYRGPSAEVLNVTTELRALMLIGEEHLGTTFAEFELGMEEYVESKGYTYTSTSVFSWGSFNFENYKSSVKNGKPVAIFLSGFAMLNGVTENSGQDIIHSTFYATDTHVVVGCGYRRVTYFDGNGREMETRTYLKVASGLIDYNIGYLNINGLGNIDRAISIEIS